MAAIEDRLRATGLVESERPEGCPGSYVFHAYCRWENPDHGFEEFPHEALFAETLGQARSQLRAAGWIFHPGPLALATCPKCAVRLATPSDKEGGE